MRIEIDGHPPDVDALTRLASINYGHFTAMQVRGGAVRGLELHLRRLEAANEELFGMGLDRDLVRAQLRHALGDDRDASVRVTFFTGKGDAPSMMIRIAGPAAEPKSPLRLVSVPYLRPAAHLKHLGSFGQIYHARAAERAGFDDALLIAPDGRIAESTIANIGFHDGTRILWPDAPVLPGITMLLLERELTARRIPTTRRPIGLSEIGSRLAAFVTNSHGIASVSQIDDTRMRGDDALTTTLLESYAAVPWDPI